MSKTSKSKSKISKKSKAGSSEDPGRKALHIRIVDFIEEEMRRSGNRITIQLVFSDPEAIDDVIQEWCVSDDAVGKIAAEVIRWASCHGASQHTPTPYKLIAEDHLGQQREISFHVAPGTPGDAEPQPFVLKIDGIGVHVDVRVDRARSLANLAQAIRDGVNQAIAPVMPALIASLAQFGGPATRDVSNLTIAELDQLLESIQAERDVRAGMQS
jgi:hypothetical protein